MRRLSPLLLLPLLLLAACGGSSQTTTTATATSPVTAPATSPPRCVHRIPRGAGDCIKTELGEKNLKAVAPPTASARTQGVDVSRWQGLPSFTASGQVGFSVVQTNDGPVTNPFFGLQVASLNAHRIPWGAYTFLEGYSGARQADLADTISRGRGRTLGLWGDAEQGSAYPQACSYTAEASRAAHIVGVYGSPGTYRGGRCRGFDWPAEWGSGRAYPLPGYPASATKLRQWCGTCRLAGFSGEVDRDEDLGLLALAHPKPSKHQQLAAAKHRTAVLLADLHRHGCFHVHGRAAYRLCPRWGGEWRHEAARVRQLEREGVR